MEVSIRSMLLKTRYIAFSGVAAKCVCIVMAYNKITYCLSVFQAMFVDNVSQSRVPVGLLVDEKQNCPTHAATVIQC